MRRLLSNDKEAVSLADHKDQKLWGMVSQGVSNNIESFPTDMLSLTQIYSYFQKPKCLNEYLPDYFLAGCGDNTPRGLFSWLRGSPARNRLFSEIYWC